MNDMTATQSVNTTLPQTNMFNSAYAATTVSANMEYPSATSKELMNNENQNGRLESQGSVPTDIFAIPEKFSYPTGPSEQMETDIGDGSEVFVMAETVEEPEL